MSSDTTQHDAGSGLPPEPTADRPPRRLRKLLGIAVVVVIVGALAAVIQHRIAHTQGGFRPPGFGRGGFGPLAVGVAKVTTGDVPIVIDSLGTVTPLATVTVHPMVTGPLVSIPFKEGQMVDAGQLLAQIDPRPFQAAVDQAQAQLQHDQALLANARVDLDRYKTLMETNSVAEQTYATQQATVLQDQATVVSDKAALETAQLNLQYTHITAPVTGLAGLRQVDNGNVVSAYSSSVVVVTQMQPMSVLFTIPEDNLTEVLQRLQRGEKLPVVAYDRTFTTKLDSGVLTNSDDEVDTGTGTLKLRAMFNNAQDELFPDQFVNIRLTLDILHNQVLVPGAAVQTGPSGSFVYVVDQSDTPAFDPPGGAGGQGAADQGFSGHHFPGARGERGPRDANGAGFAAFGGGGFSSDLPIRTVHLRYIKTGPSVGDLVSVVSGLQVGETVVVDGVEQLRDGAPVTIPNPPAAAASQAQTDSQPQGDSAGAGQDGSAPVPPAVGAADGASGPAARGAYGYGVRRFPRGTAGHGNHYRKGAGRAAGGGAPLGEATAAPAAVGASAP